MLCATKRSIPRGRSLPQRHAFNIFNATAAQKLMVSSGNMVVSESAGKAALSCVGVIGVFGGTTIVPKVPTVYSLLLDCCLAMLANLRLSQRLVWLGRLVHLGPNAFYSLMLL